MTTHLLFDFDGTLIDSSKSILATFESVLEQHRLPNVVPLNHRLIGPPLRSTLEKLTGISDPTTLDSLTESFKRIYDDQGFRKTATFPGVEESLRRLSAAKHELIIVTNKRTTPTLKILDFFGWSELFQAVYPLDKYSGKLKNKNELVRWIIAERSLDIDRAAMIGDTMEDMAAAVDNGLYFFGATWGYGSLNASAGSRRVKMLASPSDLGSIQEALENPPE